MTEVSRSAGIRAAVAALAVVLAAPVADAGGAGDGRLLHHAQEFEAEGLFHDGSFGLRAFR